MKMFSNFLSVPRALPALAGAAMAGILMAGTAQAALTDYSTDFTSADGFSDGTALNGIDGWVSRTGAVSTAADTATHGAFFINGNGPAVVHQGSGGSFDVGDSLTLTADVFYTGNTQNNQLRIGLRETATGTGAPNAGVKFNMDATVDGNFDISGVATGGTHDFGAEIDSGFDHVLGQANAETFVVTFTKLASPDFSVDWSLRGGAASGSFTVSNASLWSDTEVYAAMSYNGPTGGQTQVDSFSVDYNVVPEPASLALLGLGGVVVLTRGRR